MATIGTITVEFAADLLGLQEGITEALDLFEELSDSIDSLSEQIEDASSGVIKIHAEMDKKSIEKAKGDVKGVSKDSKVTIGADTSAVEKSASKLQQTLASLRQSFAQLPGVAGSSASEVLRFAENSTTAARAGERLSASVRRSADKGLVAATGQSAESAAEYALASAEVAKSTKEIPEAATSAASAIRGVAEASTLATAGEVSATVAIDKTIVAIGRSRAAYIAGAAAIGTVAKAMGGASTIAAAYAGSAAATAISVGTLAGAAAGSVASLVTYKAVMGLASYATSGLSDEARGYVNSVASMGAVTLSAIAGVRASAAVYGTVATAIFRSSSATDLFREALQRLGVAATQGATRASGLLGVLGRLLPAIELVTGAANKEISLTQYAALATRVVASSAAFGAASGAIGAWAAGTSVAAGAAAGAGASVAGFVATLPAVAPAAIAAAVATGRYAHELEELSLKAQAVDQMASRFGASAEEITKLRLAAANTGVGMGQLAKGQQAFYTSLSKIKAGQFNVESVREAKLAYDKLNISLDDIKNKKPEEAFKEVAEKLSAVKDPAEKTAIAFDLFGKQGAAILPALKEFGELEQDFRRLGGALTKIDFQRFLTLETSFDRLKAASANLSQTLLIPFVELQKAFNNLGADMRGGLSAALTPIMGVLADMTKPLAVVIELFGRVMNIMLRIVGAVGAVATAFLDFALIADLVAAVGDAFTYMLSFVEEAVTVLEKIASVIASFLRPSITSLSESITGFAKAFAGAVAGAIVSIALFQLAMQSAAVQAIASAAAMYAAIAVAAFGGIIAMIPVFVGYMALYAATWILSAGTAIASAVAIHAAWLMALGPIGIFIGGLELAAAGLVAVYTVGEEVYGLFVGIGGALGFFGEETEKINAATASIEELAAAAEKSSGRIAPKSAEPETAQVDFGDESRTAVSNFGDARTAVVEFGAAMGVSSALSQALFGNLADGAEKIYGIVVSSVDPAVVAMGAAFGMSADASREAFANMKQDAAELASEGLSAATDGAYSLAAAFGVSEDDINDAIQSIKDRFSDLQESTRGYSASQVAESVSAARDRMGELTIESAKFGQAGADAAAASQKQFNDLQQQLADGSITLEEFDAGAAKLGDNLEKNLDILKNDAPEVTLKKNLELYKQLDDAAKAAGKAVRDIGAGTVIDDKFFPTSEAIKSKAAQYKAEYVKALEEIKKKQQSGVFAAEIKQKQKQNQADFDAGRISKEQFIAVKLELDSTNAQEQASIAAEEVKREFDRKNKIDIELDTSFADSIRKSLDEAFLSPVQKFEKELKKIKENKSLTPEEAQLAEVDLRKKTTESLIGKTAQSQLTERTRDVTQARDAGLISTERMQSELDKAGEDFAKSVGVTKAPFEEFQSSMRNIATQFGFAGQSIDDVRNKLSDNEQQLDLFDRAVKESKDSLLQSLGVEKSPVDTFSEQRRRIRDAWNNDQISAEERDKASEANSRKLSQSLGFGDMASMQFKERRAQILDASGQIVEFSSSEDKARTSTALNKLDMDKRSAAGLDATAVQSLNAGISKVNDVFGVTGKSMDEIQKTLSPDEFKEYQDALKKNKDAVRENLGVERTGADKIAESRSKLAAAFGNRIISEEEMNKALKNQKDALLSSLGISKSPTKEFEDAVDKIKENASELSKDEIAKGLKEAKDKLLSALGIDKSPAQQAEESMDRLREAMNRGKISSEEFAKGSQKAKDTLLQSLGIPLNPVTQLKERMNNLKEAFSKGQISQEEFTRGQDEARRSMIPGGEEESPVKKFERDMKAVDEALNEGLIESDDAALRKKNLQAQLQEDLKPSLDKIAPDRRGIEGSDTRSKGGVDTFFRILRGNDNPSLKAQLEVARNTKILAEAAKSPEARPVLVQLAAR